MSGPPGEEHTHRSSSYFRAERIGFCMMRVCLLLVNVSANVTAVSCLTLYMLHRVEQTYTHPAWQSNKPCVTLFVLGAIAINREENMCKCIQYPNRRSIITTAVTLHIFTLLIKPGTNSSLALCHSTPRFAETQYHMQDAVFISCFGQLMD